MLTITSFTPSAATPSTISSRSADQLRGTGEQGQGRFGARAVQRAFGFDQLGDQCRVGGSTGIDEDRAERAHVVETEILLPVIGLAERDAERQQRVLECGQVDGLVVGEHPVVVEQGGGEACGKVCRKHGKFTGMRFKGRRSRGCIGVPAVSGSAAVKDRMSRNT
jgi:hypothetical protein